MYTVVKCRNDSISQKCDYLTCTWNSKHEHIIPVILHCPVHVHVLSVLNIVPYSIRRIDMLIHINIHSCDTVQYSRVSVFVDVSYCS